MLAVTILILIVGIPIPSTNSIAVPGAWSAKTSRPGPLQEGEGAAAVGTSVYVIGGSINATRNDIYDTVTGTWSAGANLPVGIVEPAGVIAVNGLVYVISGTCRTTCSSDTETAGLQIYHPVTNTWSTAKSIPTARNRAGVVALGGTIYVIGGYVLTPLSVALNVVEAYDIATNMWSTLPPMPTSREGLVAERGMVAGALGGDKIYAIGGLTSPRNGATATGAVEVYDPLTNSWASFHPLPMPTPRGVVMGVVLCGGSIFVMGGINSNSGTLSTNEAYSPSTSMWTEHPAMPTNRAEAGAAVVQNTTYIIGGFTGSPGAGDTGVNEAYTPFCKDFSMSASKSSLAIPAGSSDTSTINLVSQNLTGTVSLGTAVTTAGTVSFNVAVNLATNRMYVTGEDVSSTVSVFDGSSNNASAIIAVGATPLAVDVNPTTNRIYVANAGSPPRGVKPTVSVIDGRTGDVISTLTGFQFGTSAVAVNPTTNHIYVTNGTNAISVIDGNTNVVVAGIPVGPFANDIAVNNSTNRVYVTGTGTNNVTVIDGSTNKVLTSIPVGAASFGVGVNPITDRVYVANNVANVTVIDGKKNAVVTTIPLRGPFGVGVNPATNRVYVTNLDNVTVIDSSTNKVVARIPLPHVGNSAPFGSGVSVNQVTNRIYVTGVNALFVIDGSLNSVVATIPLGPTVGVSPASATLVAGGAASSILTVSTSSATIPGGYSVDVIGTNSSLSHSVSVGVNVEDLIISGPASISGIVGSTSTFIINLTAINGFTATIGLTSTQNVFPPTAIVSLNASSIVLTSSVKSKAVMVSVWDSNVEKFTITIAVTTGTTGFPTSFVPVTVTVNPVSPSIGGTLVPIDKLALLAPYIGFASVVAAATVLTMVYLRRVKSIRISDD